ncbi:MAG: hypothetical protein HP008_06710, partial [Clostridia bacterium]|nr:hypothetical protein [Clostridia bacterium]
MKLFSDILLYTTFLLATGALIVWFILFNKKMKAFLSENELDEDLPKRKKKAYLIGIYLPIIIIVPLFALALGGFFGGGVPKALSGEVEGAALIIPLFVPVISAIVVIWLTAKYMDKLVRKLSLNVPEKTESEFYSELGGSFNQRKIKDAGKKLVKKYGNNIVQNVGVMLFMEAFLLYFVIMLFTLMVIVYRTGLLVV